MEKTFSDLSKYIKKSPPFWILTLGMILIFSIEFTRSDSITKTILFVIFTLVITLTMDQLLSIYFHSKLNLKKNLFLFVVSFLIFYAIYLILDTTFPFFKTQNIAISLSFTAFFRYLVFYVYLSDSNKVNFLNSLTLSLSFIPFFLFYADYTVLVETVLYGIISGALSYIFVLKATTTFKNEFNEEPRNLIKFFLYSTTNKKYLEAGDRFFKRMYNQDREVQVNFIRIVDKEEKDMTTFVFPYIHPGPFGTIGTSDLPNRLQDQLKDLNTDLMVFHTSTTNNNNCSGDIDINNIANSIRSQWNQCVQSFTMSRVINHKSSGAIWDGMKFGDFGFIALNPDKLSFDDILLTEGEKLAKEIESETGIRMSILDAQNNFEQGATELSDIAPFSHSALKLVKLMNDKYPGRMGYFKSKVDSKSLGVMGVQACAFDFGDHKEAILLTDSNNITSELMKEIRKQSSSLFTYTAIYTTDNHIVNQGSLDMNPLGQKDNVEEIATKCMEALRQAALNIKDVTFRYGHSNVNVKMGTEESYKTLMNTVFSSIGKAKYYAILTISLTFIIPFIFSITGIVYKIPFIR
jgi:putative membrane protein